MRTLSAWSVAITLAYALLPGNVIAQVSYPLPATSSEPSREVRSAGAGLASRLAPGEMLPLSVKLLNFGSERRADVQITYRITDADDVTWYVEHETVAVETTASFVKQIPLPANLPSGAYIAESSIRYDFQEMPANSYFQFTVEPKIFGVFRGEFILYATLATTIALAAFFLSRLLISAHQTRLPLHDYSDKGREERIYYEIISDTINQMRLRVGSEALQIAKDIPDLKIDPDSGKVLEIHASPSKIIALLVLRYETLLGRKVELRARSVHGSLVRKHLQDLEKNAAVVRKYFE